MNGTTYSTTIDVRGQAITVASDSLLGLSAAVEETRRYFRADAPSTTTSSPSSPAPASSSHTCQHGEMVHKSGESKTSGKSWSGWFCPLPRERKDDQCPPEWD